MQDTNAERERSRTLARLEQVEDLEVADNDHDVRGWSVIAAGGDKIGKVDELIVDPSAMKVRYLETRLEDSDQRMLIPVERATLNPGDEKVVVPLTVGDFRALPPCPVDITEEFSRTYDVEWNTRYGAAPSDHTPVGVKRVY